MKEVNISALTRPAQPRSERLRGLGSVAGTAGGSVQSTAGILTAYITREAALRLFAQRDALALYLPLTGGILSGALSVRCNNARLRLCNAAGNGAFFELNTEADLITLNPTGDTEAVRFRADGLHASKIIMLEPEAEIRVAGTDASIRYDADTDSWIFNRPIRTSGDVVAYSGDQ